MGASISAGQADPATRPGPSTSVATLRYESRSLTSSATSEQIAALAREKKKRISGFATLRKKLIRRRRTSKSFDHAKVLREFVSDWSPLELSALVEEYEASSALKDLVIQADLARPPASSYKQDLSDLFDYKYSTDVDLIFQGACFPVHRALLCARCPYFREILSKCPGYGAQIHIDIRTPGISVAMFSALLRYLYTGDFGGEDAQLENTNLLIQLSHQFGTPNLLDHDLRYLLETGDYADAILVFTSDHEYQQSQGNAGCSTSDVSQSDYGFNHRLELPCHKAILSARSSFFRNLIQRRTRSGEEYTERTLHIPTKIVLDETVIPKRYARVLLHAIYLDTVDLSCIIRDSQSTSSLCEAQALANTGRTNLTLVEEAMELYQIGRFLELDILAQGCEDVIVESLSIDNMLAVLRWSEEPHGSAWVSRQVQHFLREEFQAVVQSPNLLELDKCHLLVALTSDFVQASELEVLQAVLRWGEHQLVRRMEEREPNLLSHTAHSVAKKGIKKRDLNDVELREILSELLPHVRMDHVLPPNSEILTGTIKRGLVSIPPSHMIGDDRENLRVNAWIRGKNNGLFVKPRLFTPYYEEAKVLLDDHLVQEMELVRLRMVRRSHIPDTLYMVEEKPTEPTDYQPSSSVDVVAGAVPVPDSESMAAMLKREHELRMSPSSQRAYSLPLSSKHEINKQIRLRVVREFNLPDTVGEVLEGASYYYQDEDFLDDPLLKTYRGTPKPSPHPGMRYIGLDSPSVIPDGERFRTLETETSSCSEGHLSDIMPDVAMATSTLGHHSLPDHELELDLGDGTSHTLFHHHHHHHRYSGYPRTYRSSPMFL